MTDVEKQMDTRRNFGIFALCLIPILCLFYLNSIPADNWGARLLPFLGTLLASGIFGIVGISRLIYSRLKNRDLVIPTASIVVAFFPMVWILLVRP
jgi:hypothetical protein